MKRWPVLLVLAIGCGGAAPRPTPARATLADLGWLQGDWATPPDDEGCVFRERWQRVEGRLDGSGEERCTGDEAPRFTETLAIELRGGGLAYVALPSGQERTEFVLTSVDDTGFVAENPSHDFPTRIEYRRTGETTFDAIVSGTERSFTLHLAADAPSVGP